MPQEQPWMQQPEPRGTQMWGFVFRADLHHLDSLCRRYLNLDPTGSVAYEPLAPLVLLQFSVPGTPLRDRPMRPDRWDECELSLCVPIRRRGVAGPMFFVPYAFSNDPTATVELRERYGVPFEVSYLNHTEWPRRFRIVSLRMKEFGEKAVGDWGDVLYLVRLGSEDATNKKWLHFDDAALELQNGLIEAAAGRASGITPLALGSFWPPNGAMVQLKQFPDALDGGRACYTSIVEIQSRVRPLRAAGHTSNGALLGNNYRLSLPRTASHPLSTDLGLHSGQRPLLAYEMRCRVSLGEAREVWRAPSDTAMPGLAETLCELARTPARKIVDFGARLKDAVESILIPPPRAPRRRRIKPLPEGNIAILGGGVGAMAAAFALSDPKLGGRYKITVYQMGWRLGGKGASGRNALAGERIEEHGLHGWFGFYDNAFAMMRACYRELKAAGELTNWPAGDEMFWGFEPQHHVLLQERGADGTWTPRPITFPPLAGLPGDNASRVQGEPIAPLLGWLASELGGEQAVLGGGSRKGTEVRRLAKRFAVLARNPDLWSESLGGDAESVLVPARRLRRLLGSATPLTALDSTAQRSVILTDLAITIVVGLLLDVLPYGGDFDRVDEEVIGWLRRHGAGEATLQSEYARVLHAMSFAYAAGNPQAPATAAGPAIRALLSMLFGYRGAFLCLALRKRGVRFEFFHRVKKLALSADKTSVDSIELGVQATPADARTYPYLRWVKNSPCWPNRPEIDLLAERDQIRRVEHDTGYPVDFESAWSPWGPACEKSLTLKQGKASDREGQTFDRIVLAISLGALPGICGELIEADPGWRAMVREVGTARTQAFQLWLTKSLTESGYPGPSPLMTTYERPIENWADFSQTLAAENHDSPEPKQVAYFCGPLSNHPPAPAPYTSYDFPAQMKERAFGEMRTFVQKHLRHLLPGVCPQGGLDYAYLHAPAGQTGEQRLRAQYYGANVNPSDLYVLSLPGTTSRRLRSEESGFDNLALAGDWTFNGLNVGCVEAAVMSGMRAAQAILGRPLGIAREAHLDGMALADGTSMHDAWLAARAAARIDELDEEEVARG